MLRNQHGLPTDSMAPVRPDWMLRAIANVLHRRVPSECTYAQLLAITGAVEGELRVVSDRGAGGMLFVYRSSVGRFVSLDNAPVPTTYAAMLAEPTATLLDGEQRLISSPDIALPTVFRWISSSSRWLPVGGLVPVARGAGGAVVTGAAVQTLLKPVDIPVKLLGPNGRAVMQFGVTASVTSSRTLAIKANGTQIQSTTGAFNGANSARILTDIRNTGSAAAQTTIVSASGPYSANTVSTVTAINTDAAVLTLGIYITPTATTETYTLTDLTVDVYSGA